MSDPNFTMNLTPKIPPAAIPYTVGFAFDASMTRVALILKNRPSHLAGRLNGPGGKVEVGETYPQAMQREMLEETGLDIPPEAWSHFTTLSGVESDGSGHFSIHFYAVCTERLHQVRTCTDEEVVIYKVTQLPELVQFGLAVDNLAWLVLLAADHLRDGRPSFATIHYTAP